MYPYVWLNLSHLTTKLNTHLTHIKTKCVPPSVDKIQFYLSKTSSLFYLHIKFFHYSHKGIFISFTQALNSFYLFYPGIKFILLLLPRHWINFTSFTQALNSFYLFYPGNKLILPLLPRHWINFTSFTQALN